MHAKVDVMLYLHLVIRMYMQCFSTTAPFQNVACPELNSCVKHFASTPTFPDLSIFGALVDIRAQVQGYLRLRSRVAHVSLSPMDPRRGSVCCVDGTSFLFDFPPVVPRFLSKVLVLFCCLKTFCCFLSAFLFGRAARGGSTVALGELLMLRVVLLCTDYVVFLFCFLVPVANSSRRNSVFLLAFLIS